MAKRKKPFVFSSKHLSTINAVVGALFVIAVFLSANTHARFLAGGLVFLFGLAGIYVFGIAIFAGSGYVLSRRKKKLPPRFIFATVFVFLGLMFIFPPIGYGENLSISNIQAFFDDFNEIYNSLGFGLIADMRLGGGILGYVLSALLFQGGSYFAPIFTGSLLLLVAMIISFWPLLVSAWRRIKAEMALRKAKKIEEKQQAMAESLSPFGIAMPEENIAPQEKKPPERPFAVPPIQEKADTMPLPTFAPASKATLPSRRSLRKPTTEIPVQPEESPSLTLPSPDKPFMASATLHTSGFHRAFFGPVSKEKEEAVIIPVEENKPQKVHAPLDLPSAPSVSPQEVPTFIVPSPELPSNGAEIVTAPPAPEPTVDATPAKELEPKPEPAPVFPAPVLSPTPAPSPAKPKEKDEYEGEEAVELPPYTLPPISLLQDIENAQNMTDMEEDCAQKEAIINKAYADLHAGARVVGHIIGPSVTQFSIQPDDSVSVSTLGRFQKDLEMRLGGMPTRFAERVAGMSTCALEVANSVCRTISFKELFTGLPPLNASNNMFVPFGEDINGVVRYADLTELPHMLVAGTTGSGKSVFIHCLLFSLLMRNRPEELKLVLVDPKRVEMNKYRDLPHLLCPIIKEPSEAKVALKKLCDEMDRRFKVFEHANVQNIRDYNDDYCEYAHKKKMPFIVVVIDEFADLVGSEKEVSDFVLRIGQKARAAGIHMIIATQRPDVKIITGTIKSNLPTRIALTVASTVDSQTILGVKGAEELNGKGDMLIDCVQVAKKEFVRAQGAFVTPRDMRLIGDFIRGQLPPDYDPAFMDLSEKEEEIPGSTPSFGGGSDFDASPSESTLGAIKAANDEDKYQMIKAEVMKREFTSISQIQRDYSVGFPRAGKIYSRLLKEGIISLDSPNSSRGAKVVVHAPEGNDLAVSGENTTTSFSEEYE